jgi:uncharacterized membrane protein
MSSNVLSTVFATRGFRALHPLHAIVLAFPLPAFLGAWISDLAYASTYQIQWSNFAAWLIVGGLAGGAVALACVLTELARDRAARTQRTIVYATVLASMWLLGLVNAFVHGKDAWAIMPEAVWLSFVTTALALVAAWIGFSGLHAGERR